MTDEVTFAQAVNEAHAIALSGDESVITFGMGVGDPKNVFGTTGGLRERFGPVRVFDVPASENGLMGIAVGAALGGLRPVIIHQRFDFFLLAMDQLVNGAAKWHYVFSGAFPVPVTIRLIVGRGWGQGPTHSQSLHAWLAHVPGIKVVMPATPADAKGLLLSSIFDDNPVVFIEHRWLHNAVGEVPEGDYRVPLGKARVAREGRDLTIVACSLMVAESLRAASILGEQGLDCEVIDLRSVNPIDWPTIFGSVEKTGRLLAVDIGNRTGSVAAEVIAGVCEQRLGHLRCAPVRIALPDFPTPTSPALIRDFYPGAKEIMEAVGEMVGKKVDSSSLDPDGRRHHDVPGDWFHGPF